MGGMNSTLRALPVALLALTITGACKAGLEEPEPGNVPSTEIPPGSYIGLIRMESVPDGFLLRSHPPASWVAFPVGCGDIPPLAAVGRASAGDPAPPLWIIRENEGEELTAGSILGWTGGPRAPANYRIFRGRVPYWASKP